MITIDGVEYEVWSMGPLHGTVWARDTAGQFVVVNVTKNETVDYELPPGIVALGPHSLQIARDVLYRHRRSLIREDLYLWEVQGRPEDLKIAKPSDALVEAARGVIETHESNYRAEYAHRLGHVSRNAVGEARLLELLHETVEEVSCASEMGSTAATE